MGVISEIFIARRADLTDPVLHNGPTPPMPVLSSKGVSPVELATLATILLNESLDDINAVVARCPDAELDAGDEGPWLIPVPASITSGLAALDADGRRQVGDRWFQTEEWQNLDWPEDVYIPWFNDLCKLAAAATRDSNSLWLWMSL